MHDTLSLIFNEAFLTTIVRVGVPLMFASMSAYVAHVGGLPNIAGEGIMLMSALFGVLGSYWTQNAFLGLLIAVVIGVAMALLLAFMNIKLGANAFLVGIALNTFASSFTIFLLYICAGSKGFSASLDSKILPNLKFEWMADIPVLRAILYDQHILVYACFACMIIIPWLIYKTPYGLRLRATGYNEKAAETLGVGTSKMRVSALAISGLLASLGGAYMTMGYLSAFTADMIAGRGWIGFAAQAMGGNSFIGLTLTTLGFSVFQAIVAVFSRVNVSSDLLSIVPYAGVLFGVIGFSVVIYMRNKKNNQ